MWKMATHSQVMSFTKSNKDKKKLVQCLSSNTLRKINHSSDFVTLLAPVTNCLVRRNLRQEGFFWNSLRVQFIMEKKTRQKEASSCDCMCVGKGSRSYCVCNLNAGKDEHCYPVYPSYFGQVPCSWHSVYQEIQIQSMGQCRITRINQNKPE